ncbi:disease resistance protein At4g27190-like [Pistacia vera]|uniref:disease resistance protein At4g27190-like n=1 Tax=Pistacia vera TaxID=55513 RepID=UPI0012635DA1|nr:disease resistance protein At4g27190-like [Pistacia vera]
MEFASSVVGSITGSITDCLFGAAGRHLGYLFHYNDNIGTLENQAKKLAGIRERVQGYIDAAARNLEIIETDVQNWMTEVDKISAEAAKFLEDEVNANKRCLNGWCINPRSRYRFSKEAKDKNVAISQLLEDWKVEKKVSRPAPPPGIIYPSEVFSGTFESRKSIMKQILEALGDDNVSIVGVCGMGGVGKTTLVTEIVKQAGEDKRYGVVVMTTVSQTVNIMNIQGEIARMLGLKDLPDDSETARARSLWERIKKEEKMLVILDDVWRRIELYEIGIPFGNDHRGCKIVLTSRSRDVCDEMDAQPIFTVATLSKEESWVLFKEKAGACVDNSDLNPIARQIAAECGGLPIAVVTIATTLKNKNKYVWIDAARQLKTSTPTDIRGLQGSVISSLELSIKYLESEDAKSLFFFCSLFPEDFEISITILARYGAGLGWFKNVDTMEHVRDRASAIVSSLVSSFLLIHEENDDDDEDYDVYVKMHDVVRDVAHIIAPKYNQILLVKAGIGLEEWPERDTFESLTCISLMSNNIKAVPDGMECPKLQSLLLQKNHELVLPNNFFQGMKDLRVLDLSKTQLLPLPESLSLLTNLRTLYLYYCKLGDLSIIGQLSNLEILSLCGSNIREIPISFSKLIHLRLLDLNLCLKLKRIAHGVISALCKLEELYIFPSSMLWDFEGDEGDWRSNAKLAELQCLSDLTRLEIFIPNQGLLPDNNMLFKKLSNFTIIIGDPKVLHVEHFLKIMKKYSRKIMISGGKVMISRLLDCLKNLIIEKTEFLRIIGLENMFRELVDRGFNELRGLAIRDQNVMYLLNTLEGASNLTFKNLEELQIWNLANLIEICHGEPSTQSFNKLKSLAVLKCNRLSNIVPSHLLQRFQNLENFAIDNCKSVVHIFDCEELKVANGETKLLSSLKNLKLEKLPKMTKIWKGDTQYINLCNLNRISVERCPKLIKLFSPVLLRSLISLEEIEIIDCKNLEEIFIFGMKEEEEYDEKGIVPWRKDHTTTSPSLGNLTSVIIIGSSKLKNLFTPSIVKRLVKLKSLRIVGCSTLHEIITNEEASTIQRIVFPSLSSLHLVGLDNIACFSSGSSSIEFPDLESVWICECPNMKIFGYGEQLTPKLNKVIIDYHDEQERWMGNLNSTVQQLFIEQEGRRKQLVNNVNGMNHV